MSTTTKNLFTYGTLRVDEIWLRVVGRSFPSVAGTAHRFAIRRVRNTEYPGIFPQSAESVPGRVYLGVDAAALAQLDRFEGSQYVRTPIEVECEDGVVRTCEAYVIVEECRPRLSDDTWRLETFVASGAVERFRRRYTGFEASEP